MKDSSSILFNEKPLVINTELAALIGLNEALILQQIQYWININKANNKNYVNGRYWVYQTYEDWGRQFPFFSRSTIARTLRTLDDMGVILKGNFNKMSFDKTVWYSIDYDRLEELKEKGVPERGCRKGKSGKEESEGEGRGETEGDYSSCVDSIKMTLSRVSTPVVSNCDHRECQNDTIGSSNMNQSVMSECDSRKSQNDTANTRDYSNKNNQENQTTTTETLPENNAVVLAGNVENTNNRNKNGKAELPDEDILVLKKQIEKELGEAISKKTVRELASKYGMDAVMRTLNDMEAFRRTNTIRSQTAFFIDAVRGRWTPPILQTAQSAN